MRELGRRPAVTLGPVLVVALIAMTLLVAGTSWQAPLVPVERGEQWAQLQKGLGINVARSVPSWWTVVLFAVAALGCHAQAVREWGYSSFRRVLALAWWVVAAGMLWISADHALAFHESAPSIARGVLPEPLASHPVEGILGLTLLLPGLLIMLGGTWWQRLLVPLAGVSYVAGQVLIGAGFVDLPLSPHRASVVEASLEWAAALLLLLAASVRRRVAAAESEPHAADTPEALRGSPLDAVVVGREGSDR